MSEFYVPQPEENAEILTTGLLVLFHFHKETALRLQEDQLEAHIRAGQPLRAANYIVDVYRDDTPHVPEYHHRLVFGPQYNQPVRHNVEQLIVRYPILEQDYYPEPEYDQPWGDVFLEVRTANDESHNYLLNNKGLTPFSDAQKDIIADDEYLISGNLFAVKPGEHHVANLSLHTLNDLLHLNTESSDAYVYHVQAND